MTCLNIENYFHLPVDAHVETQQVHGGDHGEGRLGQGEAGGS